MIPLFNEIFWSEFSCFIEYQAPGFYVLTLSRQHFVLLFWNVRLKKNRTSWIKSPLMSRYLLLCQNKITTTWPTDVCILFTVYKAGGGGVGVTCVPSVPGVSYFIRQRAATVPGRVSQTQDESARQARPIDRWVPDGSFPNARSTRTVAAKGAWICVVVVAARLSVRSCARSDSHLVYSWW